LLDPFLFVAITVWLTGAGGRAWIRLGSRILFGRRKKPENSAESHQAGECLVG
jgi:hypothetical protein